MARPSWTLNILRKLYQDRFFYAKFTHLPAVGRVIDYGLFHGDNAVYLPRDNTIQINQRIDAQEDMVLPSQVVDHFIEKSNYHWIMNFCLCRDGGNCQDHPVEYGCLFLGEAVLGINPKLGRLVEKNEALEYARRCREAGLVHMVGRTRMDSIWLGTEPGHKLLTICNCCSCCCLFKMLPKISPDIGKKISRMDGVDVQVTENCASCGLCIDSDVCFVNAIGWGEARAVITDHCRGCGRCVDICPVGAIELTVDDHAFVKKTIQRLSRAVIVS